MGVIPSGPNPDEGTGATLPVMQGPTDRTGFFENIGAGFRQAVAGPHSTRVGQAIYEQKNYDQIIKALSAEGEQGEDHLDILQNSPAIKRPFRNPYVSGPLQNLLNPNHNPIADLFGGGDPAETQQIWAAVKRVRQRKPDFLKEFPDEAALHDFSVKARQRDEAAAQAVTSRAGTAGTVGGFIGGMAGSVSSMDPENVVGGLGGAAGKTIARTVIKRAIEGAGANSAAALISAPARAADANHLGQETTPGDVVHQVEQGAAIGALFGGAHVLVPHVVGKVGETVGAAADKVSAIPPVRDVLVAASIRAGTVQDHGLINDWARTHNPGGTIDTSTPDERAAVHVIQRDATAREASPLEPAFAGANDHRLDAVAQSLGVDLSTPDMPTTAPIQTATVRDRSGPSPRRPATFVEGTHQSEGTGKNPLSSAEGHGQFIDKTWLSVAPKVTDTSGMSRTQILGLRHDRGIADKATTYYAAQNGAYLRARGLEDSPGNLSLAHFLGPEGASSVLRAAPDAPIEGLLSAEAIRANRTVLEGKSASQVIAWAHKRIGAAVDTPVARADAVPESDPLDAADYSDLPYERATFTPDQVETDAALMQYKAGGDTAGVTGKLKDVTAWNPIHSSEVLVWEGNDGRRIVVDGHQRVGLAKRLNDPSIELPAIVLREADGITAAQARTIGALRNINLGTGTLLDNARVLRDAPEGANQIKGAEDRRAIEGLANLNYEAFGAVANGVIDPSIAAEVGRNAPPESHMAMVDLLTKERIRNPAEAGNIVRQAVADGFGTQQEHQLGMFGDAPQQSLYVPIARILDAASKRLRDEKRTFKVLATKAGKIEAAGNVLDRGANEGKVIGSDEALAILNATAHRAGPVRDALIASARAELSGTRRADAVGGFLDALAGIDLRTAAAGVEPGRGLGEPPGETGIRDASKASDEFLSESHGPQLFDHAVAARDLAEPFSDPVGQAAKDQTAILEHDLRVDAANDALDLPEALNSLTFALKDKRPLAQLYAKGDILSLDGKVGEVVSASDASLVMDFDGEQHIVPRDDPLLEPAPPERWQTGGGTKEAHPRRVTAREIPDAPPAIVEALSNPIVSVIDGEAGFAGGGGETVFWRGGKLEIIEHGSDPKISADREGKRFARMLAEETPTDPNLAAVEKQKAALKAASPLQSVAEQQGTMGLSLFDVADQPTFRLSDEGDAKPLHEIMAETEADTLAAQALRDCLK